MTTTAAEGSPRTGPQSGPVFLHALASEWTKLWTVRSTYWTLLAAVVVTIGYSALVSGSIAFSVDAMSAERQAALPSPLFFSLIGVQLGQIALVVLGALVIASEYRTGMIRASLIAVPQRQRFLVAKILPFTLVALVVSEITAFVSFFVGQAFFATQGMATSLSDPGVLRAVIGAGLYLTASGVFGIAVGALARNVAAAIAVGIGLLLVLPPLLGFLPGDWGEAISNYFLTNAGMQVMTLEGAAASTPVGPWVGLGIFCAYIAAVLGVAAVLLQRRDA